MDWQAFWNERYNVDDYVFGTEPNDFLRSVAAQIPPGPVLCLGEGEGRNAVYLASLGHPVLAVDQSATGLAKACRLARHRGLSIETAVADMADFQIIPGHWSAIISIFLHLPPDLRRSVNQRAVQGLCRGGLYISEHYTPAQLAHGTGGPKEVALLPTLELLREDLQGLDLVIGRELERGVVEGSAHTGQAAVVQMLARK
jgi:hypothetical protein